MANDLSRRRRADTSRETRARSPDRGLRGTPSSGARPRPRCDNNRGACAFLPPPERGRVGEGARLGDRARNVTPTRRWPTAIATLPLTGGGITPPFGRDALRPFGLDHAARHMPPGEARRRSFWNFGKHGQRLGPGEEKRWARRLRQSRLRPEGWAGESASQALRQFRDVASHRKEAAHGARAQAIDQAVDQRFGRGLSVPLRERGLRRGKRLGHERGKRHEIDAEAHVERLDLVLDEAQKMLGLARGGAQACLDHGR